MKLSEEEKKKLWLQKQREQKKKFFLKQREKQIEKRKQQIANKEFSTLSAKRLAILKKDEEVYKLVWDSHPAHKCEECGTFLGNDFYTQSGEVANKERYSHILTKAAHPKLRHIQANFKLYCNACHHKWEFGTDEQRKQMKTYDAQLINQLLQLEQLMNPGIPVPAPINAINISAIINQLIDANNAFNEFVLGENASE